MKISTKSLKMTTTKSVKRKKPNRTVSRPSKMAKFEIGKKPRHHFVSFPLEAAQLTLNAVSSASSELWSDPDSPTTSIFHSRMLHWSDLNLTQAFVAFTRTVGKFTSLPLVIHNKETIFANLKEHITIKDEFALESLYDLCSAFALDLQHEFGPYYNDFVELVADSSKMKNAAVIKACFDALNQVIKMLLRSASSSPDLLLKTLRLFQLGIPPITHRLCAGALAQILRKSGSELPDCVKVLLENAANGGGLVELAGMILVQSLKTTSKSVVVNATKILEVTLEAIDNLDWPEDDVTNMISAMLENLHGLEAVDVQKIVSSILNYWLSSNDQQINSKIRSVQPLLKLVRSKTSKEAEVLARKFLTKCLEVEDLCEDALVEAVGILCSGYFREEAWTMLQSIMNGSSTKERKARLLESISNLDHFESAMLHRMVQYLAAYKEKDESVYLATEGLSSFARSKLKNNEYETSYVIEFPCANPNDLNTLPNRLLVKLETAEWDNEETTKVLSVLSVIRPLHQDIATKLFKNAIRKLSGDEDKVEPLGLAVRALGEISCPHDFLEVLKESKVLETLRSQIDSFHSAQTLAYIFSSAASSNAADWIDAKTKREFADQVLGRLHLATNETRLCLVRCIVHLSDHVENFGAMLSAESIQPNIQSYREKLKFISALSCPSEITDEFLAEANLRFLLSNLSVNFSLLWDPCIKVIDSYWLVMDLEKAWNIFYSIFRDVNAKAADVDGSKLGIDFQNFRNLLLKSLDSMVQFVEKKNSILATEFLDVFMQGKHETSDAKGLAAFIGVYKQLSNLRSVVRFDEIRGLAERCLGDHFSKTRETAVDFFATAYKELRQHKTILMDLVDPKKWKSVFLTFPMEVLEQSDKFCQLLCLIMVGKVRQTTKEKRKDQLNSRKGIVRSIFQLGKQHGLEFLRLLHKQQISFLNDSSIVSSVQEMARKLDMVFDVYLLAANSAVTCVDGVIGGAKEIFTDLINILKYQGRLIVEKNTLKKRRPKVLEQLIQMFKALQANDWTEEEEQGILNEVIWPLLQPESNEEEDSEKKSAEQLPQQRVCYLAKIITLFNMWISLEKYTHWFFLKNPKGEIVLDWVRSVFTGTSVAEDFRRKLFSSVCRFVLVNSEGKKERLSDEFVNSLLSQFESWFQQKGKCKGGGFADLPSRLAALSVIIGISRNSEINEKIFFDNVISYAARGVGETQTNAIVALNSLINRRRGEPPASAYKLLTSVVNNEDNKTSVRKMLWKHTENLGLALNDKILNGGVYKTILSSPDGVTNRQFLFLLHFAASEIYTSDYTNRSTAGTCLRELIYVMKQQKSEEDYLHLVDSALLPVLTRGLQAKTERVQSEFIEILLEAALDDGRLGNNVNISSLRDNTEDPELDFFVNMKHIQKHRRARALNRLAARLDEDEAGFINVKCCHVIVYPLACSYLFNNEYTKYSDTIQAAIACVGSLCAKFSWKEYKVVLMYFLNCKPSEPAHQKQRVKVLAAILNSFHFVAVEGDTKNDAASLGAARIVNTLLTKMRLQKEDDEVDCALYVPILKILLLYPNKLKANISTLLAQTSRKLRSRFIEDRKLARDILCEIAALLGPNYFSYILSVLEGALQRGYQLHILVHTINVVMLAMEPHAFHGCFDSSIPKILEFVGKELFGSLTEEKKVSAIVKKTPEAMKVVGYSMLESLASRMSKSLVCDVISGLLNTAVSAKSIFDALQKLRKAIKSIQTGLARNKDLERPTDYLQLSYGILSGQLLSAELVKAHSATLREFAFSLLLAGTSDTTVTGPQIRPFWPFLRDALENKDVNVIVSCLKFLSIVTQNKDVCDVLIDCDDRDFVGVISSKCKQYQAMKNRQPYMCVALVLRNLLTNGDKFEADHLKAICLFFEGCLDTNRDDTNAMRLLGLVLFRFYSTDAYAPFLKLLCTSCVQCRSESSYNVAKSILVKIAKKHGSSFNPAMNFFVANINYEEETGRRRSITMCNLLLESCPGHNFETQGLFVECATRLFNEYSSDCKKLLEALLTTIIKIQHKKKTRDGKSKNLVHELIVKWCCSPKPMHIGIGAKLMSLSLCAISDTENSTATRKSLAEILPHAGDVLCGQGDDGSTVYSFALAHIVELFNTIVTATPFKNAIFSVASVNAEKVSGLVLHQNSVVRRSVVKLFSSLLKIGIDETSERHETTFAETTLGAWISGDVLRTLVSNICELAKTDPTEQLSNCLSSIFQLSERGNVEELTDKFVYKKARSIFTHEKFNLNQEWSRRKLYYDWARDVCEKTESVAMKELIKKYLAKDMKQAQLADLVNEVQRIIEDSFRKQKK